MGIPAAAIVDFDIVKGNDLKDLLNDCFVPPDLVQSLGQLRGNVEAHFRDKIQDMKSGGISLLVGGQKESCQSLLDQLSSYGIFIVPNGEVESWLRYLGINASKIQWLPEVFARMGSNPERSDYVTPIAGDVWAFLENASKWIRNSDRIGMPGPQ
jgi:hypothetical protein